MGVGMPAALKLDLFADLLWEVFGNTAYLVGSALSDKSGWRDVDIRSILTDKEYERWFPGLNPDDTHRCAKWCGLVLAFTELGKTMTGLPIDFQIDQQTYANSHHKGPRSALGFVEHRFRERVTPYPGATP